MVKALDLKSSGLTAGSNPGRSAHNNFYGCCFDQIHKVTNIAKRTIHFSHGSDPALTCSVYALNS